MKTKLLTCLLIALGLACSFSATAQRDEVSRATKSGKLQALGEQLDARDRADYRAVRNWSRRTGIPQRRQLANGRVLELQRVPPTGPPIFYVTNNVDAADTVSTDDVWPGGVMGLSLDGSDMTIGEWDGGAVLADHPDLFGRVTQMDGVTEISDHSTHVAGTLVGAGVSLLPEARGMAYAAQLNAYDWNDDTAEMAAAAAAGLLLSNHSYGVATGWLQIGGAPPNNWWWMGGVTALEDSNFGFYDAQSQLWDQVAWNAPYYLIVKAAGNDRWDFGPAPGEEYTIVDQGGSPLGTSTLPRPADCSPGGYDCLPTTSVAKNILTIGAVDDVPGGYAPLAGPSQVQVTGFSGFGPTDDGRIKPDLVGNGWLLLSTYGHDPYFAPGIGTSMAASNVSGSLLLLQQHHLATHGSFLRAATLKALAIHTADETGDADGPDYRQGWGLLNTRSAAEVISGAGGSHQIIEGSLANGGNVSVPVSIADAGSTLRATLVWTDPPGTPSAPALDPPNSMLVNDLDLRATAGGTTYLPWVLDPTTPQSAATTGDNTRDNVEQVVVYAAPAGSYSIVVSHKGTLLDDASQDYALIISVGPGAPASQGLVLDEAFSGSWPPPGWSVATGSGGTWQQVSETPGVQNPTGSTGNYAMVDTHFQYTVASLRTPVVDLSSATAAVLRFHSFFYHDTAETINVDVSTDGGSGWDNVWFHQGFSNMPKLHSLDLTGSIAGQADVMLRFRFQSSSPFLPDGRYWQIDDVELEAFGSSPPATAPPGQADNPAPVNGAVNVGVNSLLAWTPGALADSHDVYLDTDSSFTGAGGINQAGTSFDPGTLDHDTTYYWRIDAVNSDGITPGPTWSFTTAPPGC